MNRQEANLLILDFIAREVQSKSDLRFGQILSNIGLTQETVKYYGDNNFEVIEIIDYNEESETMLKRILGE